jgi:hypothetical protein
VVGAGLAFDLSDRPRKRHQAQEVFSMSIKLTIHGTGTGTCSLTGKEASDGLTVSFEDGTVREGFLSWKAFQQLLRMKVAPAAAAKPTPVAIPAGNGPVTK